MNSAKQRFIPVAAPALIGNEKKYVLDCLDKTWISSNGEYIERFEAAFGEYCGVNHALSCCNGTAALHLALLALGIGPGDEVILPTLTFVATANAVRYCGATPVFADSEKFTWNIDPTKIEELITERTRAIIAVHLYGHPVDMDPILELARKHRLWVVEDAAEAHGAEYNGRKAGSLGDVATFSFYGNKIITTGEGGMVLTDDNDLADRVRRFKGQGMAPARRYWFPMLGYNYRMTNVAAAIGLAQMEKIDWHLSARRELAARYRQRLADVSGIIFQQEMPWAQSAHWMTSIVLSDELAIDRDTLIQRLARAGIETRPIFYPMHQLPMYTGSSSHQQFPVSDRLAARGLNLPSSALLSHEDLDFVCDELIGILKEH
jgi:perosamine synthetase